MVYACGEADTWRFERIIHWKNDFEKKDTPFIRCVFRTQQGGCPLYQFVEVGPAEISFGGSLQNRLILYSLFYLSLNNYHMTITKWKRFDREECPIREPFETDDVPDCTVGHKIVPERSKRLVGFEKESQWT